MPLLSLWKSNPDAVTQLSIEQVVATAGDGKLRDESECSTELRAFLSQVPSEKLSEYADHCLALPFAKSGMVLQDIVNEFGRRLDYSVLNGRYQGTSATVGNDGLWQSPEGHEIIVEVKTTDAYRVPLDTIAGYRNRLQNQGKIGDSSSMLLVVGREDTGELEAQVRGSRHAWDMRLISVDSLIHLVKLKESTEGPSTVSKIRNILTPLEYTRLDALIDAMFTTAKDVETAADSEKQPPNEEEDQGAGWEFTDPILLQKKRDKIVNALGAQHSVKLIRKSRALYWDADHGFRIVCTVSKRYVRRGTLPYWYAYHPQWDEFLADGKTSFFVLGCMDLNIAFSIPVQILKEHLDELSTTTRSDGGDSYWHVKIMEQQPGTYTLQMPKSGRHLGLSEYMFGLGQDALAADISVPS